MSKVKRVSKMNCWLLDVLWRYHQKVPADIGELDLKAAHGLVSPEEYTLPAPSAVWTHDAYNEFDISSLPPDTAVGFIASRRLFVYLFRFVLRVTFLWLCFRHNPKVSTFLLWKNRKIHTTVKILRQTVAVSYRKISRCARSWFGLD